MKLDPAQNLIDEQPISIDVLLEKYAKGEEKSADEVRRRVARGLAAMEKPELRVEWEEKFFAAMTAGFIPGGRVNSAAGTGEIKVAASDSSGIHRVVVAFTGGDGSWNSADLAYDASAQKWTGMIAGTAATQFFVQVVDAAGNVTVNDNKGRYYSLAVPAPLATGRALSGGSLYLPAVRRP